MHFLTVTLASHALAYGALAILGLAALGACASTELGAALTAMSKCASAPEPRDWKLVDRIDPARGAAPGQQVTVQWNAIAAQDTLGRYAHVRALEIRGSVVLTSDGANAAVTGYMLRSLIQNIFLSDAGAHMYYAALNGRTIIDDYWLRHWRLPRPLNAIGAAVPAGNFNARIDLEMALVGRYPGASPIEGLIPLACLQMTDGSQGMRFTCGSVIAGNPAPAGLTVVSFLRDDGNPGLDIWADIVYLDQPVIDAPWSVREYILAAPNGTLKAEGAKTEYAAVRYFPEDAAANAGQQQAAAIDNVTLQCAGMIFGQQRAIDLVQRQDLLAGSAPESATALGLANLGQPAEPGTTVPMLLILPQRSRETAPAGPVVYNFATQPAANQRFIHRTTDCDTSDRASRMLAAIKCGTSTCYQPGSTDPGVNDATAPKVVVPMQGK